MTAAVAAMSALVARLRRDVPFYASRLEGAEIRSVEDIARLPFTTKSDFRDTYPFGLFAQPLDRVVRVHASSGTTGKPVVTGYTRRDLETWGECMERALRMAGVVESDILQNAYGYGLFTGGLGFHLGAERLGCLVVPTSSGVTQRQVMLLGDLGTTVLTCTPSYALVLAEALRQAHLREVVKVRVAICGAEPWSESMRRQIEMRLGVETFDIYGLTELGGPGVGIECHEHAGIHIFEDHFYAEVVGPEDGRPLPDGEAGELVLSSLLREATPVLRYRTRDLTVMTSQPCACGSPFRRFLRIRGRTDDMLVVRGENVFPSQIEDVLLKVEGLTGNYQLIVDRQDARLDTLEIRVETDRGRGRGELGVSAQDLIRETLGLTVQVTVLDEGVLLRSEGKAKRVIDRRDIT